MEQAITNEAKKQYYCPNHTAEHLLNQTMIRMFNCGRAVNAHIEEKKSKCDYALPQAPSAEDIAEIEKKMNDVIAQNLSVTSEYMDCPHRQLRLLPLHRCTRGEYIESRHIQDP